jgi:hypothetical protein
MEEITETTTNIIQEPERSYKTPVYTRRAVSRYQEKNKEKLNEYAKNRWREKYENDPEFREKHKQRSLERYHRKKQEKEMEVKK